MNIGYAIKIIIKYKKLIKYTKTLKYIQLYDIYIRYAGKYKKN